MQKYSIKYIHILSLALEKYRNYNLSYEDSNIQIFYK